MYIPAELVEKYNLNPKWECYDNSTLDTIDSCVRKAFWKLEFTLPGAGQPGIQDTVGIAAHFGSAIHSAMDKMYAPVLVATHSYQKRRLQAFRAFSVTYEKLVKEPDLIEEKYSHPSGIALLDNYFAYYENEDSFFEPIETEVCLIVPFTDIDPPFYFIYRLDGIVGRTAMNDRLVREFKTTSSSLQNKLNELRISRQVEGYVWGSWQFPSEFPITGVMADVIAVRVSERDPEKLFKREIFHISPIQGEQWRRETLTKIRRWRETRAYAELHSMNPLTQHFYFDRNTKECTRYRLCTYYDICVHGLNSVDLNKFLPNDWNPLHAEKMDFAA